jgi:sulfite exporter TauE/SafE
MPVLPGADATAGLVDPSLVVLFALGVVGSAHCLGMCGPVVTLYADRLGDERGTTFRELRQHGLFNAGRTLGYALVGALLGAAGGALFDAAARLPVGNWVRGGVGLAVGSVVVVAGVGYLTPAAARHGGGVFAPVEAAAGRVVGRLTARVGDWVEGPRIAALGAVHALLPCPVLYPVYLYAFSTGSPAEGGAALAALGLGTFPTLFAFGTALGSLGAATRTRLHRALGAVFLALGGMQVAKSLSLLGVTVSDLSLAALVP